MDEIFWLEITYATGFDHDEGDYFMDDFYFTTREKAEKWLSEMIVLEIEREDVVYTHEDNELLQSLHDQGRFKEVIAERKRINLEEIASGNDCGEWNYSIGSIKLNPPVQSCK